jgi:hypothetical protein
LHFRALRGAARPALAPARMSSSDEEDQPNARRDGAPVVSCLAFACSLLLLTRKLA